MAEWLIAAVLKTAVPQGTQSSNLCPSAIEKIILSHFEAVFYSESAALPQGSRVRIPGPRGKWK